ncbi:MAG: VOC family protein [Ignavibacteriaceae bacterium]|nr:VOC family protein [Ignavibacteriaceae bacterium]HRI47221.1 VOC family protein [Ignavibacteriaceae bacterium]
MVNQLIAHVEIPSSDFEASTKFYSTLFGWELKPFGNGYSLYNSHQGLTVGLRKVEKVISGDTTIFHVRVEDIDATLDKISLAGGKIEREKTVIPVFGWYALIKDSVGNILGLYQSHT